MKKNSNLLLIALVIVVIFVIISFMTTNSLVKDIISSMTALIGMIAIWYQLKKEKDISEAEFIVNLNNSFVENEGIKYIYNILRANINNKDTNLFKEDERKYIVDYLTYFETVYILHKKGIFHISEIDEMFAYRFFVIINDKSIQSIELVPNGDYYNDLYDFYKIWKQYRQKKGKEIIKEENCFAEFFENRSQDFREKNNIGIEALN